MRTKKGNSLHGEQTHISCRDELTGVLNQHALTLLLDQLTRMALRHGDSLSIMIIDMDAMVIDIPSHKAKNDSSVRLAGDGTLKQCAGIIHRQARDCDPVGRLSTETFAVVLPDSAANDAMIAAERIRDAVAQFACSGQEMTVSIGVATFSGDRRIGVWVPDICSELLDQADTAMTHSKRLGRNRSTHFENLDRCTIVDFIARSA